MKINIYSYILECKNIFVWKNPSRTSHILENFGHLHIIKITGEFLFIEQIIMLKFSTQ